MKRHVIAENKLLAMAGLYEIDGMLQSNSQEERFESQLNLSLLELGGSNVLQIYRNNRLKNSKFKARVKEYIIILGIIIGKYI